MEYLRKAQHPEPYIAFVHQLSKRHALTKRFVEAGMMVLLHASLLDWNNTTLPSQASFPEQTESQRKEALYNQAIEHFDKAQEYERAISLLKELANHYEFVHPDYMKLCTILEEQGKFYKKIISRERFVPAYFSVCFYGNGFPATVKDQEFVYRGFECERITSFISRMQIPFPKAEILHSHEELTNRQKTGDGQYIVILTVYASSHAALSGEQVVSKPGVPGYIQNYQTNNNVNVFSYSRAFRKQPKNEEDKKNEFKVRYTFEK